MIIQNKTGCLVVAAICLTTLSVSIHARSVSGAHGGSASATAGSRSAETARGGSASWSRGSGTSVETAGGRSASTSATAYHAPAAGRGYPGAPAAGYHPPVPAYGYRPPVNVNYGYSSGQVAAAGVAGLAVGAMAGSAAAKSAPPPPTTVVVQQPMNPSQFPLGTNLNNLPGGCVNVQVGSTQYYECGVNWFRPYFGGNGAYYQVVPAPY